MPAVDGEQAAARDGDGCWYAKVGEGVGGDVGDGRVGGELEHHDDVLLHLILKHQGALRKETLVRQTEKERRRWEEREMEGREGQKGHDRRRGRRKWRRRWEDRTDGAEEGKDKGGKVY